MADRDRVKVDGINDLLTASQNITKAINGLNQTIAAVFPQTSGTSSSATGGAATLPANPVGFLTVVNPVTGSTVKIPYYS